MCNCIFIGCFCVVFHCNTYELYRPFSIQIVIHIGLFIKTIHMYIVISHIVILINKVHVSTYCA